MHIHSANLLDVQDQTLALLKNSSSLIEEIINNDSVQVQGGLVSDEFLKKAESTLRNEYQKAKDLEMVIAVVGTMKAGKSTTINAIVGHEVLPNRNYPMTALPTVVTHVKGKKNPILFFPNSQPISDLSKKVAEKINSLTQDELTEKDFLNHKEVEPLKYELSKHGELHLPETNEGQEAIFAFLKDLNDLMRLAKELGIEPPYEAYSLIDDLPTIEVEFHHLSGKQETQYGKLSILDTPGPNEFGQSEKLKGIFRDQLQKASEVLLVVDYTQMNSKAGGDLREEVSKIQDSLGDRFYVMLNKFDEKGRNDVSKEDTVTFFCNQLMDGKIEKEHVFPVSAKKAFLANRALVEIDTNGSLNSQDDWVEEFGKIAFGEDWLEDIDDSEDVIKKATRIWKKSDFFLPLEKIISEANSSAPFISLYSALDQLDTINQKLGNGLNFFNGSLTKNVSELESIIATLEQDRERVEQIKSEASQLIDTDSKKLEVSIIEHTKKCIFKLNTEVDKFLNYGEATIVDREESHYFKNLFGWEVIDFEEDERSELTKLVGKINKVLNSIHSSASIKIQDYINEGIESFEDQINQKVNSLLQNTIESARELLGDSGLSFSLSFEGLSCISAYSPSIAPVLERSTEMRKRFSIRQTRWGKFKSVLNDSWGWDSYIEKPYTEECVVLKLNMLDVKQKSKALMAKSAEKNYNVATDYLTTQVKNNIDDLIYRITSYLEQYRQTLIADTDTQKQSKTEKEALMGVLKNYNKKIQAIEEYSKESKQELEGLLSKYSKKNLVINESSKHKLEPISESEVNQ